MKKIYSLLIIVACFCCGFFTSCEGEKDIIVIENVPLKLPALYMVGDAAPCGWNIGDCTPMTKNADDAMIFEYKGHLNTGEFKLPLESTGNWGCTYLMPPVHGVKISLSGIEDPTITLVPGGNPDNKWVVTEAGEYYIGVNLRTMQMEVRAL